jgi:hypothetical protein
MKRLYIGKINISYDGYRYFMNCNWDKLRHLSLSICCNLLDIDGNMINYRSLRYICVNKWINL